MSIESELLKFNSNRENREILAFYNRKSYMELAGVARREESHSAFLAWLLKGNEISSSLAESPMMWFLQILAYRENTLKDIVECISSKKIQILCINDSGCNIFETAKSRINNSFKQKFPNMSKYEKVPEKKESPVMSTKDKVMNDLDIIKKRIQLQRARYEAMIQGNNFL